jgi:hypothetical protein
MARDPVHRCRTLRQHLQRIEEAYENFREHLFDPREMDSPGVVMWEPGVFTFHDTPSMIAAKKALPVLERQAVALERKMRQTGCFVPGRRPRVRRKPSSDARKSRRSGGEEMPF